MNKIKSGHIGNIAILIVVIIISNITFNSANINSIGQFYLTLGKISGLLALFLMMISIIMSTRSKTLIKIWGNLPRLYIWHHIYGGLAYILALIHPVLLSLQYMPNNPNTSLRFWLVDPSNINIYRMLGLWSIFITTGIMIITLYIKVPYHIWKKLHRFLGFSTLLALIHGLFINSHIRSNPILLALFITIACYVFIKYIAYSWLGGLGTEKYVTKLVSVELLNNINIIKIKIRNHNIACGQFVYISLLDISTESHPLSVVSIDDNIITLMAKQSGDWTKDISLAQPKSMVLLEGPYGSFRFNQTQNKHQIWVSGGIGITPFLGQIKEVSNNSDYKIDMFIALNKYEDNIFSSYLIESENITYHYYIAQDSQCLKWADVAAVLTSQQYSLLVCAPPSMQDAIISKARRDKHISEVISEKFEL